MISQSLHCSDETPVICTLKNQISSLVIDIGTNEMQRFTADGNVITFTHLYYVR
jgi:hypothetical protein